MSLLTFFSNMNIHEDLHMVDIKVWHPCVNLRFLTAILAILEHFLSIGFDPLIGGILSSFLYHVAESLPELANCFVFGRKLGCMLIVVHSFEEIAQVHVRYAPQVEGFDQSDVHSESCGARVNRSSIVTNLCLSRSNIL